MPDRDGYMPGVPCWIDTRQPDQEAAAAFYTGLFGWEFENAMPPGMPPYLIARLHGGDVAAIAAPGRDPAPAAWNTYIWVDGADDSAVKVRDAGGRVVEDPFDVGDSGRMAVCLDPEGAAFCLWQAKRHRGAQVVNQPGSLNFNNLAARDEAGAKAFYGAAFGWETMPMGAGAQAWRLPGYGEFLERSDPGLLERMAGVGAPEGFADVVATLVPITDDQADLRAHWAVTFAVEDADAAAARAAELGADVLAKPADAPWVRATVIRDPQGATFTASQFVPENAPLPAAQAA